MRLFDKKIKTAWVSGFSFYERWLIDKLKRKGFNINVFDDAGFALNELESKKYGLIVVNPELSVGKNIDEKFKLALLECRNEEPNHSYEYDCLKIGLYLISRIKLKGDEGINKYTPLVVIDYFSKFAEDLDKERFIVVGANNVINSKMDLDEIVMKMKSF